MKTDDVRAVSEKTELFLMDRIIPSFIWTRLRSSISTMAHFLYVNQISKVSYEVFDKKNRKESFRASTKHALAEKSFVYFYISFCCVIVSFYWKILRLDIVDKKKTFEKRIPYNYMLMLIFSDINPLTNQHRSAPTSIDRNDEIT